MPEPAQVIEMPNRGEGDPPVAPVTPPVTTPVETPAQRDARLERLDRLQVKTPEQLARLEYLARRGLDIEEAEAKAKQQTRQGTEDFEERAAFLAKYGPRLAQGDPEALYDMIKEMEGRGIENARGVATEVWNEGWETLTAKQQREVAGYNAFFGHPDNKDIAEDKDARAEVERLVGEKNYTPQQAAEAVREKLALKKELKEAKAQSRPAGQHYEGNRAAVAFDTADEDPETKTARANMDKWREKPPGKRGSEAMFSGGPSKWSK